MSAMASSPTPLRVTATGFATHVVEVRGLSKLRRKHRGKADHDGGWVCSETFTVDGLEWMVYLQPDGEGAEQGYLGAFVELATEGVTAWAKVSLGLVDWTTGLADTFFPADDPVLFDAGSGDCYGWGTGTLASWRRDLRWSRYLRRDGLKIECVIDVCRSELAFPDPPAPKLTPRGVAAAGKLGSAEGADVFVHVAGAGEPIPAHTSVLDAYAPRFLKKHNLGRRRRPKTGAAAMRVDVDGMPRPAVAALLQFAYTGTLPVVDGLSTAGYRDMFRHLLLAARRYGMRRLAAICERVLARCVDVDTAPATLAMARRHGFKKLEAACFEFVSDPLHYGLVRESEGYAELQSLGYSVEMDLCDRYCERRGIPCDVESQAKDVLLVS